MKDKIQIALLTIIAGALVYLAVSRTQHADPASSGTTTAATSTTSPTTAPATIQEATKPFDPMAEQPKPSAVDNAPKTTVVFDSYEHDFGNIKQDSENKYTFKFTNTGKEPLIIESATGSCGCTVPDYPKEPIAPGKVGEIHVVYKPGKQENQQQKQVTVVSNAQDKQTILRIKANVEKVG